MEIMNNCRLSLFPSTQSSVSEIPELVRPWENEDKKTPISSSHVQKMDFNAAVKEKPITGQMLHLNDKLRIGVGKALELILVQIHDEKFIGWSELDCHLGELLVEVAGVLPIFLEIWRGRRRVLSVIDLQS